MTSAFLAHSLIRARADVNHQWPGRDHSSDGWIGDAAHQLIVSDHNPDSRGMVHAIDVDKDGVHVPTVLAGFIARPPTKYVIHNRRIWQAVNDFAPQVYTGDNPHTGHIHESIRHTPQAEEYPGLWTPIGGWNPITLMQGGRPSQSGQVRIAQAYLLAYGYVLKLDGDFGPQTSTMVARFQKRSGITVDSIIGPQTVRAFATGRL